MDDGLHGHTVEHAADAEVGVGLLNPDVALFTPAGTPRVAHDEVVLVCCSFVTPPDSLDCVVDSCEAGGIVVDPGLVGAEGVGRGIERDRGRAIHKSCLEASS